MEIYKDLSSPSAKEFESLLNAQLSKVKIEEGKIIEGVVTKITDKFVLNLSAVEIIALVSFGKQDPP